jgi:hypothetical protein
MGGIRDVQDLARSSITPPAVRKGDWARANRKQGKDDVRGRTSSTYLHMPDYTQTGGATHLPWTFHPSVGQRLRAAVGLVRGTSTFRGVVQRGAVARRAVASGVHVILAVGSVRDDRHGQQRAGDSVRGRRARRAGRVAEMLREGDRGIYARSILESILAPDGDAGVLEPRASADGEGVETGEGIASREDGASAEHFPDVRSDSRGLQLEARRQVRVERGLVVLRSMFWGDSSRARGRKDVEEGRGMGR